MWLTLSEHCLIFWNVFLLEAKPKIFPFVSYLYIRPGNKVTACPFAWFLFFFWDGSSLCGPDLPETKNSPAFTYRGLGLQIHIQCLSDSVDSWLILCWGTEQDLYKCLWNHGGIKTFAYNTKKPLISYIVSKNPRYWKCILWQSEEDLVHMYLLFDICNASLNRNRCLFFLCQPFLSSTGPWMRCFLSVTSKGGFSFFIFLSV
jgi:hypothetical protein